MSLASSRLVFRPVFSCRPSVWSSTGPFIGLIVPATSYLAPSGLGLRTACVFASCPILSFLFFLFLMPPAFFAFLLVVFGCTYIPWTWSWYYFVASGKHLCCTSPQKIYVSPILWSNPRLEAPLPLCFFGTTFRNSAITPTTPLIRKGTARWWTLKCPHYRVAKSDHSFRALYRPRHCCWSLKMWLLRVGFNFPRTTTINK